MENKGLKEINELFDALDLVAKIGGKAYQDKKIDVADLPLLMELAVNAKVMLDAFSGLKEVVGEAKDLDGAEQMVVLNRVFSVAKSYEDARKGA